MTSSDTLVVASVVNYLPSMTLYWIERNLVQIKETFPTSLNMYFVSLEIEILK